MQANAHTFSSCCVVVCDGSSTTGLVATGSRSTSERSLSAEIDDGSDGSSENAERAVYASSSTGWGCSAALRFGVSADLPGS